MANFKFTFCCLLLCYNLISISSSAEAPTVKTESGVLKGKYLSSRNGREYEAFVGIRFGVIPARFENSVLSPAWEGTKDAIEFGSPCVQPSFVPGEVVGAEDCLFLNVYTPKADNNRRPVLVFIHGGGFVFGTGDGFGAKYFMDEEIVLVTINYRLGIFGFLDTRDGVVSGNMGLRDQVLALRWVQENIDAFGGDASRVTVSGESAGGASAMFMLISPLAKGLFHHVFSQSGTPTNPWAYRENTLPTSMMVGKKLECDAGSSTDLVACLKKKSLSQILAAQGSFVTFYMDSMFPFPPTMETKNERNPEPFLRDTPADILKAGEFHRVPVLMTVNREEGSLLHAGTILRNPPVLKQMNEEWGRVAPITFLYENDPGLQTHRKEVSKKLYKFYFGNDEISLGKEENLTNLYTDSWFLKGIHQTALDLAKHTTVYTGLITHQRKDWSILSFFGITENLGVTAHADELSYLYNKGNPNGVFATISPNEVVDKDDVEFSKAFVKTVVSFASSGIPKVNVGKKPKWTSVTKKEIESGDLNFLNVGLDPYIHVKPFQKRIAFWQKLYKYDKNWDKEEL